MLQKFIASSTSALLIISFVAFHVPFSNAQTMTMEEDKIVALDGAASDMFGKALAFDGSTLVISSYLDDDLGNNSGSVYVYQNDGANWVPFMKLNADDGMADDWFGYSVDVDGNYLVVGARMDHNGHPDTGSAYVFENTGGFWVQKAKLSDANAKGAEYFGSSVAISQDTIVVSAPGDDVKGINAGVVFVYQLIGTEWTRTTTLYAGDPDLQDNFGNAVAIDGDIMAVGCARKDTGKTDSGVVYIFERSGSQWNQTAKLVPTDRTENAFFGSTVAVEGTTVVIGAFQDSNDGANAGSAYVFQKAGTDWIQVTRLKPDDRKTAKYFGVSVAISGDTISVGATGDDQNGALAGAAYLFKKNGPFWLQTDKLTASDGAASDFFGVSTAVSSESYIVGAYTDDDQGTDSGSVYVYHLAPVTTDPSGSISEANIIAEINENEELIRNLSLAGNGTGGTTSSDTLLAEINENQQQIESSRDLLLSEINANESLWSTIEGNITTSLGITNSLVQDVSREILTSLETTQDAIQSSQNNIVGSIQASLDSLDLDFTPIENSLLAQSGVIQSVSATLVEKAQSNRDAILASKNELLDSIGSHESSVLSSLQSLRESFIGQSSIDDVSNTVVRENELNRQILNSLFDSLVTEMVVQTSLIESASAGLTSQMAVNQSQTNSSHEQILENIALNQEQIQSSKDTVVSELSSLSNQIGTMKDNTALMLLLPTLDIKLDSLIQSISNQKTRDIETALIEGRDLPSLFLPQAMGGELEAVQELVQTRVNQLAQAGYDMSKPNKYFNKGVDALGQNDYFDAYDNWGRAYRELIKEVSKNRSGKSHDDNDNGDDTSKESKKKGSDDN